MARMLASKPTIHRRWIDFGDCGLSGRLDNAWIGKGFNAALKHGQIVDLPAILL